LFRWDGDEEKWGGSAPVEDLARELQDHGRSISNTG
jgi:hypothetical protein